MNGKGSVPRPANQDAYARNWAKVFRKENLKTAVDCEEVAPDGSYEERISFLTKQRDQMAEELLACRALIKSLQEETLAHDWVTSVRADRQANG